MALFNQQQKDPRTEAQQLRDQGLADDVIMDELSKRGYRADQISAALAQLDYAQSSSESYTLPQQPAPQAAPAFAAPAEDDNNIYERIEEIAEGMIDEKWDQLLLEVKKIVEWKERLEEKQTKIQSDLDKLKEDFKVLHQGVLGKLDDYDTRMRDVGTDLKAVGKVFKDVIPEFVENVKELKSVTQGMKK